MSFIKDITGSTQRKDARNYANQQRQQLQTGYDEAMPMLTEGYARARSTLQPYAESGTKANKMLDDTYGLNGTEARDAAQDIYMSDAVLSKLRQMDLNEQGRRDNAAGRFNSGVGAQADAAVRLKNYANWQAGLERRGQQGFQATSQQAGFDAQEGESTAGLRYGKAQQDAGITGQEGTNVAASRTTGINNLMKVAGLVVSGFTPGKSGTTPFGAIADAASSGYNKMLGPWSGSLT